MGICSKEKLDCGCLLKHYHGGITYRVAENCNKDHEDGPSYQCPALTCDKFFKTRSELKTHRWVHAIS